jgi:riboflavin biosynthesis pyrimidine reductase
MGNKVFCSISISADRYVAGPGQTAEKPFGDGPVDQLHAWMFDTPDGNKAELDQIVDVGAFVTDGIHSALDQAGEAAGDRDVAIAGGATTVNQYLAAGLVDELRIHIAPVTLGAGERLFDGVPPLQLEPLAVRAALLTTHISYRVLH